MNYTSIEQSKKLLELGLNPDTADMCYDLGEGETKAHLECENFICYFTNNEYPECADRYIPTWSLVALLELMPQRIYMSGAAHQFQLDKNWDNKTWQCAYDAHNSYIEKTGNTPLEAVYNMLIWLIENKFIDVQKL